MIKDKSVPNFIRNAFLLFIMPHSQGRHLDLIYLIYISIISISVLS